MAEFNNFHLRFENISKSLKNRDKALAKFKHYYDKLDKLKKERGSRGGATGLTNKE